MVLRDFLKILGISLAVLVILGIILGGAAYLTIRNLDPNIFRTEFEKHLARQTGLRIELGDIKLQWRPQPQLSVSGLKFYQPQSLEVILQSDQIQMDADLTSIWRKRFGLSQVMIQSPRIFIKRDREGIWNWQVSKKLSTPASMDAPMPSLANPVSSAGAYKRTEILLKSPGRAAHGWEFGIGKVLVRDATIYFTDETIEPNYKFEIKKLEAEVQSADHEILNFTVAGSVFNSPQKNLASKGSLDLASRSLDLVLRYGPEKVEFKGHLRMVHAQPHFEGTLDVRDLDMESVIPEIYKKGDYVSGRLGAKTQLSFDGVSPDLFKQSLKGQGTTEITDGALRNRNISREVFDRLSPVLAVMNLLGGELPPELNEMLGALDTPFQSLQAAWDVQAGVMRVSEFRLMHPNYQLSGRGSYGILDRRVDGSAQLLISQSISAYLMKKIREMELLADRNGQVVIPFRCSGMFPDAIVQPDLAYIGSRLLQGGTDQLINRGMEQLSKFLEGKKKQ